MKWQMAWPVGCASVPVGCQLNEQQYEILRLMAQGLSDKQIRSKLKGSERTMTRHMEILMELLGTESRFVAGIIAQRRGWLDAGETVNG